VRGVIDSGLARMAMYDTRRGINTLTIQKISRASADQRSGRAGRLGPGVGLRLWPEREHLHRAPQEAPEIRRLDLSEALLSLAVVRQRAGLDFTWFEPPFDEAAHQAVTLLETLGAFTGDKLPTALGKKMSAFPLHPRFSRMLITAAELGCLEDAALCAAIAQGRDLLLPANNDQTRRKQEEFFQRTDISEFQALMRAYDKAASVQFDPAACSPFGIHGRAAFEAMRSCDQVLNLCKRQGLLARGNGSPPSAAPPEALARALLSAFADHLGAETGSGSRVYQLAGGYRGHLEKDAHIKPPALLVAAEIAEIQGKALQVKLNQVTRVELEWLRELFPDDLATSQRAAYDSANKRVVNLEETRFRSLVLQSREKGEPNAGEAAALLADEIVEGRLQLPLWNERTEQWIERLNSLAEWMPELELPKIGDEDRRLLIEQMCLGAFAYRQIKDRSPEPALEAWLSNSQKDLLERYAPERVTLANGKSVRVEYRKNAAPQISVILQHLYDTMENPRIAAGRVQVSVNILAPSQRPVQVTSDLGSFWKSSYQAVKTQLKGRYPKHEWR